MNKRIGLLVLAALCAVAFSAVAASGASAKGITVFTCVSAPGNGEFENSHCNPNINPGTGKNWKHVAVTQGETTQLTLTAIGTTKLKTKIAGSNVTLEATEVECTECHITNVLEGTKMTVTGSGGKITYKGVTINVASCKVVGGMVATEPLKLSVAMAKEEETAPIQGTVAPVEGTTEAVIHLEKSGTEPCALGSSITVTGLATGNATGATAVFATGEKELLVGTQKAELIGEVTLSGGLTGGTHSPLSATTTAT